MAHDFGQAGEVLTGAKAETRPGATLLPGFPQSDFYLMHHPNSWEPVETADGDWEWLPKLKQLLLKPGVNGVRSTPGGGVDDSQARINFQNRGWTILPRDLGYVVRYQCRGGGSHYALWDTPHKMGNRVVTRHDPDRYNEFRRELVVSGVIKAPEPEALEIVLDDLQHRLNRNAINVHVPTVAAKIKKTEAKLDGAKAAVSKTTKKKPARKRTRKAPANV